MTVSSFEEGDLFIYRITKYHSLNPDNKWANSYEFKALIGGGETELLSLAVALTMFEQGLHLSTTVFDRVLISTWEPDSVPYNPATFISSTLTGVGTNPSGSNPIALTEPLVVARNPANGRTGHLFYRNVLTEDIVSAPAGKTILDSRTTLQGLINDSLSDSGLDDFVGLAPTGNFQMVMVNADGTQVRAITQLRAQGVTQLPLDHAWFNRTTT